VRVKTREVEAVLSRVSVRSISLLGIGSVTSVYWNAVYQACHPLQKQASISTSWPANRCVSSPASQQTWLAR